MQYFEFLLRYLKINVGLSINKIKHICYFVKKYNPIYYDTKFTKYSKLIVLRMTRDSELCCSLRSVVQILCVLAGSTAQKSSVQGMLG